MERFLFPWVEVNMILNVEFRVTVNQDDEVPGMMIEQALTVVGRGMTTDRSWGGLAVDTKILGSEVDLITYADRAAVGVCVCDIQYRYGYADPRNPNPAFS